MPACDDPALLVQRGANNSVISDVVRGAYTSLRTTHYAPAIPLAYFRPALLVMVHQLPAGGVQMTALNFGPQVARERVAISAQWGWQWICAQARQWVWSRMDS